MKKYWVAAAVSLALMTGSAMASDIGVVDVQKILQDSSKAKSLRAKLQSQFGNKRDKMMSQSKQLQSDMQKLQKNQSVMSKSDLTALKNKISSERDTLGKEQGQFQQAYFKARNDAMETILQSVEASAAIVAKKKDLDLVVAKNTVIYAKNGADITDAVISGMK